MVDIQRIDAQVAVMDTDGMDSHPQTSAPSQQQPRARQWPTPETLRHLQQAALSISPCAKYLVAWHGDRLQVFGQKGDPAGDSTWHALMAQPDTFTEDIMLEESDVDDEDIELLADTSHSRTKKSVRKQAHRRQAMEAERAAGKQTATLSNNYAVVRQIAWQSQPTSTSIASSLFITVDDNKWITLFTIGSGGFQKCSRARLHKRLTTVAWMNNDEVLVGDKTGDVYKTIVTTGANSDAACLSVPQLELGHLALITAIQLTDDQRLVCTADNEGKLRVSKSTALYDIQSMCMGTGRDCWSMSVTTMCLVNQSKHVVTGGYLNRLYIFEIATGDMVSYIDVADAAVSRAGSPKSHDGYEYEPSQHMVTQLVALNDNILAAALWPNNAIYVLTCNRTAAGFSMRVSQTIRCDQPILAACYSSSTSSMYLSTSSHATAYSINHQSLTLEPVVNKNLAAVTHQLSEWHSSVNSEQLDAGICFAHELYYRYVEACSRRADQSTEAGK